MFRKAKKAFTQLKGTSTPRLNEGHESFGSSMGEAGQAARQCHTAGGTHDYAAQCPHRVSGAAASVVQHVAHSSGWTRAPCPDSVWRTYTIVGPEQEPAKQRGFAGFLFTAPLGPFSSWWLQGCVIANVSGSFGGSSSVITADVDRPAGSVPEADWAKGLLREAEPIFPSVVPAHSDSGATERPP